MREKTNNRFHSTFRPIPEDEHSDNETDITTHQLIESLSKKIEEMNVFISQTKNILNDSQKESDFRSSSSDISSTNCSITNLTDSDSNSSPCDNQHSSYECFTSNDSSSTSTRNSERITGIGSGIGGTGGSGKISADTILMGSSRFEYTTGDNSGSSYIYGFTNSEFFAFIASLDPIEYILVITVIAILLATQLNISERQLFGGALIDIGIQLGNIVEQELFQRARQNEIITRQRHEALQCDIKNIYEKLILLQDEINDLKDQLHID